MYNYTKPEIFVESGLLEFSMLDLNRQKKPAKLSRFEYSFLNSK